MEDGIWQMLVYKLVLYTYSDTNLINEIEQLFMLPNTNQTNNKLRNCSVYIAKH